MVRARTLLVTGAAGFLGGTVVDMALALPQVDRVVGVDARPSTRLDPRFTAVQRDVRASLRDLLEGVDWVFHGAFLLRPGRNEREARSVNVDATASLLAECERAGVGRVVYPSSTTVYGAHAGSGFHVEEDARRPVPGFRYAEHKVEVEDLLAGSGMSVAVLRACIVLGPGAANFITESLGMRILPVPADADPPMQFLHRDDFADAVRAALLAERGGVFNIAGRGTVNWREAVRRAGSRPLPVPARLLAGLTEASWRLRLQSRSPGAGLEMIRHPWLASIGRIEREWGWAPRCTSAEALASWVG